jgi:hypothetical protein
MIQMPAIRHEVLNAHVERELAPYDGDQLRFVQDAVVRYMASPTQVSIAQHQINFSTVIREAADRWTAEHVATEATDKAEASARRARSRAPDTA